PLVLWTWELPASCRGAGSIPAVEIRFNGRAVFVPSDRTVVSCSHRSLMLQSGSVPQPDSRLVHMSWDPVTRIVGSLGIHTKIDFDKREVVECYSTSSIFRGYSVFMKGKDPRDAHFISSRICGICGDNHATCACYTQTMAF